MKKKYYKEIEKMCPYFTNKIWKALLYIADYEGEAEAIRVQGNKVIAIFDGYLIGCCGQGYNETEDKTYYIIPDKIWKPLLISYGFIPKDAKVYFRKYYNYRNSRRYFIKG